MPMLTIELPDDVQRQFDAMAAAGGYARVEDYVRDFIIAATAEPISEDLEAHLLKAMESPGRIMERADWEAKARQLVERHQGPVR